MVVVSLTNASGLIRLAHPSQRIQRFGSKFPRDSSLNGRVSYNKPTVGGYPTLSLLEKKSSNGWRYIAGLFEICQSNSYIESLDDSQTELPTKDSYGEATRGGRCARVSMPGPVTGIYFVYHKLPEPQTPSRICPRTQGIAAFRIRHSN
ncbi:hypothetical protein F2Q69_00008507 [Brassica cretica]|uniref:Uncharacterized protein n=1 Tax=Brassica cretica TaxID=69181 RepID=A0A8S9NVS7_BRACR|nr:hypothetical protein F2Q69_00008507 [Brassica cretica]